MSIMNTFVSNKKPIITIKFTGMSVLGKKTCEELEKRYVEEGGYWNRVTAVLYRTMVQ